jgi:hypothetical protein
VPNRCWRRAGHVLSRCWPRSARAKPVLRPAKLPAEPVLRPANLPAKPVLGRFSVYSAPVRHVIQAAQGLNHRPNRCWLSPRHRPRPCWPGIGQQGPCGVGSLWSWVPVELGGQFGEAVGPEARSCADDVSRWSLLGCLRGPADQVSQRGLPVNTVSGRCCLRRWSTGVKSVQGDSAPTLLPVATAEPPTQAPDREPTGVKSVQGPQHRGRWCELLAARPATDWPAGPVCPLSARGCRAVRRGVRLGPAVPQASACAPARSVIRGRQGADHRLGRGEPAALGRLPGLEA